MNSKPGRGYRQYSLESLSIKGYSDLLSGVKNGRYTVLGTYPIKNARTAKTKSYCRTTVRDKKTNRNRTFVMSLKQAKALIANRAKSSFNGVTINLSHGTFDIKGSAQSVDKRALHYRLVGSEGGWQHKPPRSKIAEQSKTQNEDNKQHKLLDEEGWQNPPPKK